MRNVLTFKLLLVAVQIFFLVFLSTFPVALPFILINDVAVALRVSNITAMVLMFVAGFILAKYSGLSPLVTALAYTAIGVFLVSLTMILGG